MKLRLQIGLLILFGLLFSIQAWAYPQYYCTAACKDYYDRVLNLIGSIHRHNFDNVIEIAVFDLGLNSNQIEILQKIAKVHVYSSIREDYPSLLNRYIPPDASSHFGWQWKPGWYAWKPIAIHEVLQKFPYVLWLDAGCTIQRSLDNLFRYIDQDGYFLATIGDDLFSDRFIIDDEGNQHLAPIHPLGLGTTQFVKEQFDLENPQNAWMLDQEFVMATLLGVAKRSELLFLNEWHALTQDIRNFADDGTTPDGWGTARHDQTLLSILALRNNLKIFPLDSVQGTAINLDLQGDKHPLYMAWRSGLIGKNTHIIIRSVVNYWSLD